MEDEIMIVDNTVEEIAVEEFGGAPTGTIITTTHGMDKGDQHTIRDIVGLKTKLDNIESLKPIRSNLGGHADYYLWGEEATEDNPLGPGYFVILGEDGMIHKCSNETVLLRPTDLPLDINENGEVIIYALAGNITTADINKYYVVGTEIPYDIYAYDGVEYVQKSAYSYDGEKVIKTCRTTDALGVTVSEAGFIGNDENIINTYNSAKATDINYALVATTGVVDVLCNHDIIVGDYVFPTVSGWAAKSTGSYGYLVIALVQNDVIVQEVDEEEMLYARIVLSQSMVNAKKVSDNVDYLLAETTRIAENVIKAVSDAQTALNEVRDSSSNLSDKIDDFESSMGAMNEQIYTNTIVVDNANATAANAEAIATQAKEYVEEVANNAPGSASEALNIAKTLEKEMETLSKDMESYSSKIDIIETEQTSQASMISKANDDIAAVQTKATSLENSVITLTNKDTELANTMTLIDQKSNEQGASITALTSKIDKYSVGEYSQAYGLTQAQAADILEAGKIVFIPTDFVSDDAKFVEHYNPTVLASWDEVDKNKKHIYQIDDNYWYYDGHNWVSDTVANMQSNGYCITKFIEGYSYIWNGQKWVLETAAINVFFTDSAPTVMASVSPLYWVVGSGCTDNNYKIGVLYLAVYDDTSEEWTWEEVAMGSSNSMSRTVALVEQTQNSWQLAISNTNNDLAAFKAEVDENGANVAMVASVVKEVEGVNLDFADNIEKTPYASKDDIVSIDTTKYFVVGEKVPYDIYYYNGTQYVQKINWSYDGQRVLQPNTASIVTSANEDTSGVRLSADCINFTGYAEFFSTDENGGITAIDGSAITTGTMSLNVLTSSSKSDLVSSVEITYATSDSPIESPTTGWGNTPTWTEGQYMWQKTTTTYADGRVETTTTCIQGAKGENGTGVSIKGSAYVSSDIIIDDAFIGKSCELYSDTSCTIKIIEPQDGDSYLVNGYLFVYSGTDNIFSCSGKIQGPQGEIGPSGKYIVEIIEQYCLATSATDIGNWIDIEDGSILPIEKDKLRFRRQKYIWSDGTETASVARIDETDQRILEWCLDTDSTYINGAKIATGTITAKQIATDAIQSNNYNGIINEDGAITTDCTQGSFLNLIDGSFDSKNFKIRDNGDVVATNITLTGGEIKSSNYESENGGTLINLADGSFDSKNFKIDNEGDVVASNITLTDGAITSSNYVAESSGGMFVWGEDVATWPTNNETATEGDSVPVAIPSEAGLYDEEYNLLKSWKELVDNEDITITTDNDGNPSITNSFSFNLSGGLILPNSIIHIGNRAFSGCNKLTFVIISNQVQNIGDYAFNGCSSLTSITIPDSVTSIGEYAFQNCSSLTSIEIPNSVTTLGNSAFFGCIALKSAIIGNSITSIGDYVFSSCGLLASIEIPDSVTSIGYGAFSGCISLIFIVIPNSVENIKMNAFNGCSNLTSIVIPNSVTNIGLGAFGDCSKLTYIYCESEKNQSSEWSDRWYTINNSTVIWGVDGLHIDEQGLAYVFRGSGVAYVINAPISVGEVVIPSVVNNYNVKSIKQNAFMNCSKLSFVFIPKTITSIEVDAFVNCGESMRVFYEGEENDFAYVQNKGVDAKQIYLHSKKEPNEDGNYWHYEVEKDGLALLLSDGAVSFPNFEISSNGEITASKVSFSGSIYAHDGDIGGLLLSKGDDAYGVYSKITTEDEAFCLKSYSDGKMPSIFTVNNIETDSLIIDGNMDCDNIGADTASIGNIEYVNSSLIGNNGAELNLNYQVADTLAIATLTNNDISHTLTIQLDKGLEYTRTFKIKYHVIGGKNHTKTLTITAGSTSVSTQYEAFWGIKNYIFVESGSDELSVGVSSNANTPNLGVKGNVLPTSGTLYNLGSSDKMWNTIYTNLVMQNDSQSDERVKNSIETLPYEYEVFFDKLQPKRYKYNDGTSNRYHTGFIAQEVVEGLEEAGLDLQQFAGVMLDQPETENECWYLRKDEFVSLNTWQIQKLKERMDKKDKQINELIEIVENLKKEIEVLKSE